MMFAGQDGLHPLVTGSQKSVANKLLAATHAYTKMTRARWRFELRYPEGQASSEAAPMRPGI